MAETNESNSNVITKDWMDEYDKGMKQALQPLGDAQVIRTLQSAPDETTLAYTIGTGAQAVTYDYKVGDEVRVYDSENGTDDTNGYVYYKLYDLVTASGTTTAYWALAGAGGGSGSAMGKITVRLKDLVNEVEQQSPSFAGIVVTLTNTTDSTTVGTKTLAAGETSAVFSGLVPLKNYSVGVSALDAQHTTPSAQTVTALGIGEEKELAFAYEADEYTVSVDSNLADKSDLGNVRVTVLGTEYADGATLRVAKGTAAGTPTASSVTGYSVTVAVSGKVIAATYETDVYTLTVTGQNRSETIEYVQGGQTVSEPVASGNSIKVPHGTSPTVASAYVKGYARTVTVGTVTSYAATIGVAYSTTAVAVAIQSNQSSDTVIGALRATVSWTYDGHSESDVLTAASQSVNVPTGVTPTVTFPNAPTGYSRSVSNDGLTATYSTTILTVTVAADTGSPDLSGVAVTVTDTTASAAVTAEQNGTYKIPTGHTYSVSLSDVEGYTNPYPSASPYTATASGTSASLQATYEEITVVYSGIKIDQTKTDSTAIVTRMTNSDDALISASNPTAAIDAIRAAAYRCVGTFANGTMTVKKLDNTDGTLYADGSSAATDIATQGKDVWMRLPEFYYKVVTTDTDKFNVMVAIGGTPSGSGWKQWSDQQLLGVYEAVCADTGNNTTGGLYSQSGATPTVSVSQANFKAKARNRGTGFCAVTYEWHCIMALLYYMQYGPTTTNCQAVIGAGTSSYPKVAGGTNALGMEDTVNGGNGSSGSINFLGVENWWGDLFEWMDNVVVDASSWKLYDPATGSLVRTIGTGGSTNGYITKLLFGEYFDMVPKAIGGSETTGFNDYYYQSSSSSRVVRRSSSSSYASGGVAFVNAYYGASGTGADGGSRLAFIGNVVEA